MKHKVISSAFKALAASTLISGLTFSAQAATVSIEFTNLTHGIHFTPLLFTAHSDGTHLFEIGTMASAELQTMAEGGAIDGLVTVAESIGASTVANPAEGLLAPGASVSIDSWDTGTNTELTVTAMLLPTNDGFVGLDAWTIPTEPGTYTITLNGYDAGTEANNELVLDGSGASGVPGIPANPGGNGGMNGTGVTTEEANGMVHIHRGVIGDTDPEGGASDLDSRIHRWLNPVARLIITVQ
ncbi:spondin domain-containing protein [Marinibactrum halimedae]|uniref:Spondin domain-containing protein n=1 Tax=Marinibactrum halimedae TaxID=1444977 RepID=A0AA37WKM1_9GAMM|nr:spondin domain-containing protein [Marinibactrum halimedae]MCD9461138.1 spondin domain-containing protein [Marinibactrum halimedae]GLS24634.1 hypothetical protein GCM10007877_03480 [Marinibactrum halimedae]